MKLLYFYEDGKTELYDLSKDAKEEKNLSEESPVLSSNLKNRLLEQLKAAGARVPQHNTK
jgi:hypothetical protein